MVQVQTWKRPCPCTVGETVHKHSDIDKLLFNTISISLSLSAGRVGRQVTSWTITKVEFILLGSAEILMRRTVQSGLGILFIHAYIV